MAASSNFELLLYETSQVCQRTLGRVETFDRRVEAVEHRVDVIVERVVRLEKGEEHSDEERHNLIKKSETGDVTVARCLAETRYAKQEAAAAKAEAGEARAQAEIAVAKAQAAIAAAVRLQQTLGRRGDVEGRRRFTLIRIAWTALFTVIIPALVAWAISKGGTP